MGTEIAAVDEAGSAGAFEHREQYRRAGSGPAGGEPSNATRQSSRISPGFAVGEAACA